MNVYEARHAGRTYCCDTEGSEHYKEGGVEPIDLLIAKGLIEDFCVGNMIKYATRFKTTRNLVDLKKVSDYSHILCGVELDKQPESDPLEMGEEDVSEPSEPVKAEHNTSLHPGGICCGSPAPVESVKGKYEGLSGGLIAKYLNIDDSELHDRVCLKNGISKGACEECPLFEPSHGWQSDSCTDFKDFREVAIKWLEEHDG